MVSITTGLSQRWRSLDLFSFINVLSLLLLFSTGTASALSVPRLVIVPASAMLNDGDQQAFGAYFCTEFNPDGSPNFGSDGLPGGDDGCVTASVDWFVSSSPAIGTNFPPAGFTTLFTASVPTGTLTASGQLLAFSEMGASASVDITVNGILPPGEADLSMIKLGLPIVAALGESMTYTSRITNFGPDTATGIVYTDTMPVGMVPETIPDGCDMTDNILTCLLGDLPANQFVDVFFAAPCALPGLIPNVAEVSANQIDPNQGNNLDQVIIGVQPVAPPGEGADLEVTKTGDLNQDELIPEVTYTITVTNKGPATAQNVQLLDVPLAIPSPINSVIGLSLSSCEVSDPRNPFETPQAPISDVKRVNITCDLGDIPASDSVTLTISLGIAIESVEAVLGSVSMNSAAVYSSTPDPVLDNNQTSIVVPESRILSDLDNDELVTFFDLGITIGCFGQNVDQNPECDGADLNGDRQVNILDVSTVASDLTSTAPPASIIKTPSVRSENNQLWTIERLAFQAASVFNPIPAKQDFLDFYGPIPDVTSFDPAAANRTGVGGGFTKVFQVSDMPDGAKVGAAGCRDCIGIIIKIPDPDSTTNPPAPKTIIVSHLAPTDDAIDTLEQFGPFPEGTRAAIFGGNNEQESNLELVLADNFFSNNPTITVDGYSDRVGLHVDNKGGYCQSVLDSPSRNFDDP